MKEQLVNTRTVLATLVACGILTGCGGYASSEDIEEIRSVLVDLELIEAPAGNSSGDVGSPTDNGNDTGSGSVADGGSNTDDGVVDNGSNGGSGGSTPVVQTEVASFTWSPSGFYDDGSVMSPHEIAHYEVIYGSSAQSLDQSTQVSIGSLQSFELEADVGSTWYAAVRTVSIYGTASVTSNIVALNF